MCASVPRWPPRYRSHDHRCPSGRGGPDLDVVPETGEKISRSDWPRYKSTVNPTAEPIGAERMDGQTRHQRLSRQHPAPERPGYGAPQGTQPWSVSSHPDAPVAKRWVEETALEMPAADRAPLVRTAVPARIQQANAGPSEAERANLVVHIVRDRWQNAHGADAASPE